MLIPNNKIGIAGPKVAVITPVYNGAGYIESAIRSVKTQTHTNAIHYIYDDGSTDSTVEILNQYRNDYSVKVFLSTENRKQSFARNTLIKQALADGCDLIAFLDADDRWDSTHLQSSINAIENYDLVYCRPTFVLEDGSPAEPINIPIPNQFIGKHLLYNNYIWISTVVGKAECFENEQFDSELDNIEDWDMWTRQYKLGKTFVNKSDSTVTYVSRSTGFAAHGYQKFDLFDKKHGGLSKLKLHLACGHDYQPEYINVDLYPVDGAVVDAQFDVAKLPYPDNSVDEIRAFHIIEHFDFYEGQRVIEEWYRVLKPGGRLWLETPDFLASCDAFVKGDQAFRVLLYGHFFAMPWIPGQTHKFLFTESQLRCQLGWAGFVNTNRLPPASNYVLPSTYNLFLNVETFK